MCPEWCNDHHLTMGDDPEWSETVHRHTLRGEGWSVEVEHAEDPVAPVVFVPMDYRDCLSLEQTGAHGAGYPPRRNREGGPVAS